MDTDAGVIKSEVLRAVDRGSDVVLVMHSYGGQPGSQVLDCSFLFKSGVIVKDLQRSATALRHPRMKLYTIDLQFAFRRSCSRTRGC